MRELRRRESLLTAAKRRLQKAGRLLREAADDMSEASQALYPRGACGQNVEQAADIVEAVLGHFPTATV